MSADDDLTLPPAAELASLSLHDASGINSVQLAQTEERLTLLSHWSAAVQKGGELLELGCGQGDMTVVLAAAVGAEGKVTAVDPAPLTYGSPWTLGQAQSHISSGSLGSRITWVESSPLDYLFTLPLPPAGQYTFSSAILAHCLWYFSSPSLIQETFAALRKHAKTLCLAEWSLVASRPEAQAHVLAALAQAALECRKPESSSNVRTVLSPARLKALAEAAGWKEASSGSLQPGQGMLDGKWEVGAALGKGFERQVLEVVKDERERGVVLALRDAVGAAVGGLEEGLKGVRSMDVWVGVFV